jgi:ABC-type phosphate transport system ATPase subunit
MRERGMLILDEPTASMDVESVIAAEGLIDEYRRRANCAVILITHSPQQAYRLADEALFFHRGELEEHGECKRMIESPGGGELVKYLRFCQN